MFEYRELKFELSEGEREKYRKEFEQWLDELRPHFRRLYELLEEYEEKSRIYVITVRCKRCGAVITFRSSEHSVPRGCPKCGAYNKTYFPSDVSMDKDTWDTMFAPSPKVEEWYEIVEEKTLEPPEEELKKLGEEIRKLVPVMDSISKKYGIVINRDLGVIIVKIKEGKLGFIDKSGTYEKGWLWKEFPHDALSIVMYSEFFHVSDERQHLIETLERVLGENK